MTDPAEIRAMAVKSWSASWIVAGRCYGHWEWCETGHRKGRLTHAGTAANVIASRPPAGGGRAAGNEPAAVARSHEAPVPFVVRGWPVRTSVRPSHKGGEIVSCLAPCNDKDVATGRSAMVLASPRQPAFAAGPRIAVRAGVSVDVALVLAIDVSGSVSDARMTLQRQGYSDALCHPGFLEAVRSGPTGRVALTFVQWSEARRQEQSVEWQVVEDAASARQFAQAIADAAARCRGGRRSVRRSTIPSG